MTSLQVVLACALMAGWSPVAPVSGPVGIYGVVEKVAFEPTATTPERIQIWGAFAYADTTITGAVSPIRRGYLYFKLPQPPPNALATETIRSEWADLKAVAGTNQAVAFGRWGYIAAFSRLDPAQHPTPPSFLYHARPGGGGATRRIFAFARPMSRPPVRRSIKRTRAW